MRTADRVRVLASLSVVIELQRRSMNVQVGGVIALACAFGSSSIDTGLTPLSWSR
jgi:hypothetical protein